MFLLNKKVLYSLFCGLFLSTLAINLIPARIFAAPQATWVDQATISFNGHTFKESDASDKKWYFDETDSDDGCPDQIKGFNYDTTEGPYVSSKQHIKIYAQSPVPGGCTPSNNYDITLSDQPDGYNIAFVWTDDHNIQTADGKRKFTLDDKSGTFLSVSDGVCKDFITAGSDKSNIQLTIRSNTGFGDNATESLKHKYSDVENGNGSGYPFYRDIKSQGDVKLGSDDCHQSEALTVRANADKATVTGTTTDPNSATNTTPSCESQGLSLAWIVCPFINMLAEASTAMYQYIISPWLNTDPINTDSSNVIFQVWSSLRVIGNIVLVLAMLLIVFGHAIGVGVVDAYTAKKLLPRILLAAVLINISIYLVGAAVDVTNVMGHGLNTLLTDLVVQNGGSVNLTLSSGSVAAAGTAISFAGIAGVGGTIWVAASAATAGAFLGTLVQAFLLFILLPAFLAFLSVVVTLILRQGIITALIIVSPIVFALYCLPSGEKYMRKWWDYLFKALLLYPIIALVFGVANILALTTNQAGRGEKSGVTAVVFQLSSILLLFIPIFLIPFAFKLAGGAIGSLYGTFTGWNKRGTEAIKGNANDPESLRRRTKRQMSAGMTRGRAQLVRENVDKKGLAGFLGNRLNYGNVIDKEAAINEEAQRTMGRTTGFGDDRYVRARTSLALYRDANGDETTDITRARMVNGEAERVTDAAGNAMRMSMNGQKRYTDNDYAKSTQLYRSMGEIQEAFNYEAKKTLTDGDTDTLLDNFGSWAQQEGLTEQQAQGVYTGVAFARQGERLELKHAKIRRNAQGGYEVVRASDNDGTVINAATGKVERLGGRDSFIQELTDKKGSWAVSQMHDTTINEAADSKEYYAQEIRQLAAEEAQAAAGGQPFPMAKKARLELSRKELNNIQEMEESWVADPQAAQARPGATGTIDDEGTPGYSGLSGAAVGVQRAARRSALRASTVTDSDGNQRDVQTRKRYDENGNLRTETARVRLANGQYQEIQVP